MTTRRRAINIGYGIHRVSLYMTYVSPLFSPPTPPRPRPRGDGRQNQPSKLTQQLVGVWQGTAWKRFPLAAFKIVVVMWQIVTQVHLEHTSTGAAENIVPACLRMSARVQLSQALEVLCFVSWKKK